MRKYNACILKVILDSLEKLGGIGHRWGQQHPPAHKDHILPRRPLEWGWRIIGKNWLENHVLILNKEICNLLKGIFFSLLETIIKSSWRILRKNLFKMSSYFKIFSWIQLYTWYFKNHNLKIISEKSPFRLSLYSMNKNIMYCDLFKALNS